MLGCCALSEFLLFGSLAHGNAKGHSDIDLAVISDWRGQVTPQAINPPEADKSDLESSSFQLIVFPL